MMVAELASIADDLEKQAEGVDQLDFLICVLNKLAERNPQSKETEYKWHLEIHPTDLRLLSDCLTTLADGLDEMESDDVMDSIEQVRNILTLKWMKAVGRA